MLAWNLGFPNTVHEHHWHLSLATHLYLSSIFYVILIHFLFQNPLEFKEEKTYVEKPTCSSTGMDRQTIML